jgi:hypothetical protein
MGLSFERYRWFRRKIPNAKGTTAKNGRAKDVFGVRANAERLSIVIELPRDLCRSLKIGDYFERVS